MPSEYDISRAFKRIENDLMDSMMRNLQRHQVEEKELGMTWEQWQAIQLRELEQYRMQNAEKFTGDFAEIDENIEDMLVATYANAQAKEERDILKKIKDKKFTPEQDKGGFFRLNEGKLNALLIATKSDFARAEYAMLRRANDQYRQIIFDSMVYANVTNDYKKAVDMATHDFLKRGINSVVYKNGARHTVADYASMALRTGNKRAYLMGEGNAHDRYGLHVVRVNNRTDACPLCVGFLGKLLIDDVYGGGTQAEANQMGIPTLSDAMLSGFLHPNCKDMYSVYIEGVSKGAKPWSAEEIEQITEDYNTEQQIKYAQDTADTYTRMAKYSLDPDNVAKYEAKAKEWQAKVEELKLKQLGNANEPVAPTYHEGIRTEIPIEYDEHKLGGIIELPNAIVSMGEDKYVYLTIGAKGQIPYDELSADTKYRIWNRVPQRDRKPFLIQKSDTFMLWTRSDGIPTEVATKIKSATDRGYKYVADGYLHKYGTMFDAYLFEKDGAYYLSIGGTSSAGQISEKTIDAIKARERKVSKHLRSDGVRFRELTARQGDEWARAMQSFHTATEADRPVTLVTRAQYDKIKGEELYRGIAPQSHLRGDISMTRTPRQCAKQLMLGGVGDCFPSRGVYGDCIAYLSNSEKVAFDYATGYRRSGAGGVIARMKIKEDARVITYEEARKLFNEIADKMGETGTPYFSRQQRRLTNNVEVGKAMQMLGYDVIYEPRGDGMNVHFYMVLNRDAIVAVQDEWLEAEITESMLRRGHI